MADLDSQKTATFDKRADEENQDPSLINYIDQTIVPDQVKVRN